MKEKKSNVWAAILLVAVNLTALAALATLIIAGLSGGQTALCLGLYILTVACSAGWFVMWHRNETLHERIARYDGILQEQQLRSAKMELEKKQQELQALQSQINPHFLYNTLDTFRGLALEGGNRQLADLLGALSAMFKYSINYTVELVTYSVEMNYLRHYIQIQQLRFPGRFSFQEEALCAADQLLIQECPRFVLQPLAENAIRHGLKNIRRGGVITVSAQTLGERFIVTVSDNGCGMSPEQVLRLNRALEQPESNDVETKGDGGVGLINVSRRIKIYCGREYGLRVASTLDVGTQFTVSLPLSKERCHG